MSKPSFFRSDVVPIELRSSKESKACYGKHTHEEFSIGAVDSGLSDYFNSNVRCRIQTGSIVIINPSEVHSCNPAPDTNWSYKMLYVCPKWLSHIQSMVVGQHLKEFVPFSVNHLENHQIFTQLQKLSNILTKSNNDMQIEENCIAFFSNLFAMTNQYSYDKQSPKRNVSRAYEYIRDNFKCNISVKDIASYSGLSEYHLIHAFRKTYGITPHAMQIAMRINEAKRQLKEGNKIASIATDLGFTDQSHFHKNFKKLVAATPIEYKVN
ncbi:AraC family transcriptional regulator [Vibrio mangrovi]|uniref:AraC family transcriptional regulator n=1 Tax=Vibrio mangrovi TaxID=474394 RepID=A0A1Y6ITI4_9VIBR|nr:AraC family transcriptional regulator [Vibrio mangrovi]MDW6004675.1 AraC family transcriptional regulator [Vibrio mangrovi]SMS00965.1 Arabinose operon regulatory protein [Vibrio mangrovi]